MLLIERWIIAALGHHRFFSVIDANQAVRKLLERVNQKAFRKRPGSRASLFIELDKPALRELPAERFDMSQWTRARVNIDYHVAFDSNYYSVPYNLVHEVVEIRTTPTTVEILHKGQRVASHLRGRGHGKAITVNEHRPKSHQAHLEWTPSCMVNWAQNIGPQTAQLFERILADKPHRRDGLSRLFRADPAGRAVHAAAHGSSRATSVANGRMQLPKCQVDLETLARCHAGGKAAAAKDTAAA